MKPHAFVAMPFGTKRNPQGEAIDFNRVYAELLKPALDAAGCEVFRADEEQRAGDIRSDMFQELLVADLVLADLTLDNPNVWYELGVRHALRARGVVIVQGPRETSPFDIYTDRKLRYRLKDGAPDPACLAADRDALTAMARATLDASSRRKVSPVHALLPHLQEPEWRSLLMGRDNEFGEAQERWQLRMDVARKRDRAGDLLVLADEAPTRALWIEAKRAAGQCLQELRQYSFALEQYEAALVAEPDDAGLRARRITCLGRLERHEEAYEAAKRLAAERPRDPDALATTGRAAKDRWRARWHRGSAGGRRERAATELPALQMAIEPYLQAFVRDPKHYYSGINALTLQALLRHLGGSIDEGALQALTGGVRWAAQAAVRRDGTDYWARASLAELQLVADGVEPVVAAYRAAVAAADGNWFALDSTRQTLTLLAELGFRPDVVAAADAVVAREIRRAVPPFIPRQVVLGSGHMVDAPDRPEPRFPSTTVAAAAQAIERAVATLHVGPHDLALTIGAAGADLIFAEACEQRGARVELMLPLAEARFVQASLLPSDGGTAWRGRYYALRDRLRPRRPQVMPDELGPPPRGVDPYERCNLWLMYTALAWGAERLRLVCLWNGQGGDGPGGTQHMMDEVKRRTGRVEWIDTRTLTPTP